MFELIGSMFAWGTKYLVGDAARAFGEGATLLVEHPATFSLPGTQWTTVAVRDRSSSDEPVELPVVSRGCT